MVKSGVRVHLTEAATMKFIRERTLIPVPQVHSSFIYNGQAYILMERIRAETLPAAWGGLSPSARVDIFNQLKGMIEELRSLKPPPGTGVESCTGGSLYDSRIKHCRPRFGPFKTIQEFQLWLREGLRPSEVSGRDHDQEWQDIVHMADMQDGPWPIPVFTHADLNPFNILIRGEKVVGIIDWEFAGWYPHYWEYTSAWHGNIIRTGWQGDLDQFLEPFRKELAMEHTRQKWWGEV